MKKLVVALVLTLSAVANAQLVNTCYRGSVDNKVVNLKINRHTQGISHQLTVGEYGINGTCYRVSQALAMYCTVGSQTMAFGLEYQGQSATLQALGSVMLTRPTSPQSYILLEEGTAQGIISLSSVACQ